MMLRNWNFKIIILHVIDIKFALKIGCDCKVTKIRLIMQPNNIKGLAWKAIFCSLSKWRRGCLLTETWQIAI